MSSPSTLRSTARLSLRALVCALTFTFGFAIAPGGASALVTGPNASQLQAVVTHTASTQPGVPQVITVRLKNIGTTPWTTTSPDGDSTTSIEVIDSNESNSVVLKARSYYGWACDTSFENRANCDLGHTIEPGAYSLPVELEILPFYATDLDASVDISGRVFSFDTFSGSPIQVVDGAGAEISSLTSDWDWDALADLPRNPAAAGQADDTTLTGGQVATVGFTVSSATNISTGPFSVLGQVKLIELTGRAFDGSGPFPLPQVVLTLPTDKLVIDSLVAYQPVPEQDVRKATTRSTSSRVLDQSAHADEIVIPSDSIVPNGSGLYTVTIPAGTRFLPDNPWRFIVKVHLKDGVDLATLSIDVDAPHDVPCRYDYSVDAAEPPCIPVDGSGGAGTSRAAGRAIFAGPDAATASVTLTRVVPPAPKPVDSGGVLQEAVATDLAGKVRFAVPSIRVGQKTTAKITVTNTGTAASAAGKACVRFSSKLVILSVPKGVTQKGAVLCASRGVLAPGATATVAKGIVVRGVSPTPAATARDGADDGVAIDGDELRVTPRPARAGGVTG